MTSNTNKSTKPKVVIEKFDSDSDSDSESDTKELSTSKNVKSSEVPIVQKIDDDSEEVDNDNLSDSESSSESEADNQQNSKEKKPKESFDELIKELETVQENIKLIDKEIDEGEKNLKVKKKSRYDYERKRNIILKKLPKSHNEQVTKARKEKPKRKRKGNINGGFCKDQIVPDILVKFIGLAEGVSMKRPQVMSLLSNKLISLKLKHGQNTILDKSAVKLLELDPSYEGKIIKFGEFQTFLKGFYPVKDKNVVTVS